MFLTPQALRTLAAETAGVIDDLRESADPVDDQLLLAREATYTCLVELQAWRACHPHEEMTPTFVTAFGEHLLQ